MPAEPAAADAELVAAIVVGDPGRFTELMRRHKGPPAPSACLGVTEEVVRIRLHRARQLLQVGMNDAIGAATVAAFRFDGARCDRIVAAVQARLGL